MTAAKRSAKTNRAFFEFRYGSEAEPVYYRVVNDNEPRYLGDKLYLPVTVAHVVLPEQTIGINEREAEIQLPLPADVDSFEVTKSAPGKHGRIDLTIYEQQRLRNGAYADDTKTLFEGVISRSLRHQNGASRVVTFFAQNDKSSDQDAPLGIPANHHCWAPFGGNGCFYPIINLRETATTSDRRQNRITITGLSTGHANGYWVDGWIDYGGTQITIKDWDGEGGDATEFVLRDAAGPEFDDNPDVFVYPGCGKTHQECSGKFPIDNILNFGGFGIGIADYDPRYEVRV